MTHTSAVVLSVYHAKIGRDRVRSGARERRRGVEIWFRLIEARGAQASHEWS
jgi:hypothetical protein